MLVGCLPFTIPAWGGVKVIQENKIETRKLLVLQVVLIHCSSLGLVSYCLYETSISSGDIELNCCRNGSPWVAGYPSRRSKEVPWWCYCYGGITRRQNLEIIREVSVRPCSTYRWLYTCEHIFSPLGCLKASAKFSELIHFSWVFLGVHSVRRQYKVMNRRISHVNGKRLPAELYPELGGAKCNLI